MCLCAACGGGSGDGSRIRIQPLDLEGVELSWTDYFDPPFADQYPAVVADVNRVAITGKALAARQVMLEMNRRQAAEWPAYPVDGTFQELQLAEIESIDPLEALIDEELLRQAVERRGFLPAYEEAVEYTREQEERFQDAMVRVTADEKQSMQELLRLQGFPEEDWASNQEVVETIRQGMGLGTLKEQVCRNATKTGLLWVMTGWDCSEFLAEQRTDADIRYFVEWDD